MTDSTKVVLITGASSGIGEATARVLPATAHRVVLGARRTDRLRELVDRIRGRRAARRRFRRSTSGARGHERVRRVSQETYGRVDVIVNNAGVMPLSPLAERKVDEWDRMIDVNIRGVLHGIAAVLPMMTRTR